MKRFKNVLTASLSFVFAMGICGIAAACGTNEEDKAVDYSVTVTCEDTAILSGVKAELTDANGLTVAGGEAKALDTKGEATFSVMPGTYTVELTGVPEAYTWETATLTEAHPTALIALTLAETETDIDYTILVRKPDGSPAAGVEVQICTVDSENAGSCFGGDTTVTDAQGKVIIKAPEANYEVHILSGLPEGYTYDNSARLSPDETSVTITLSAKQSGDEGGNKPGEDEKVEIGAAYNGVWYSEEAHVFVTVDAANTAISVLKESGTAVASELKNDEVNGYSFKLGQMASSLYFLQNNLYVAFGNDTPVELVKYEGETIVTRTVKVNGDASVLAAVKVSLKCADGTTAYGGAEKALDENGEASFSVMPFAYTVELTGISQDEYAWNTAAVSDEAPNATVTITVRFGTLANPYNFASPFAGTQTVKLPAYTDEEGIAYVYYSYTATETAIYTLTYDDAYVVDVNIAKDGDHLHPIALWNIKAESYPFQLKAGETYSFRFADFRANAVGGDMPITIAKTELSIPDNYAGTWTDLEEDPTHTVVLTKTGGTWTVTYNGTAVELGLADTNGGYLFTLGGKDYTMSFPENGASLLLSWGNGEDESVFLFTAGNHPDRSPGTEGNPIELNQSELTTRTWSEATAVEGKFFTVTATATKMYRLTVTSVSTAKCEAMISIEDETGHNVLSEWMGAVGASVNFRLDEGKTYTINVGIADPTDETGMTSPSGTVAFTLAEIELAEIPQEILDINWISDKATLALTKYTVTLTTFFPFSGDVTSVSKDGDTTTVTWGAGGYTLIYDATEKTLTVTMGENTYTFAAKEDGGTISLPEGWNGTYQRDGYKVVIDGTNIKISFGTHTDVTVTITGYDETSGTISFTADGITGSIQKTQSWEDPATDNISNVSLTVNGETQRNLSRQA